ncbi:L,D-transpeptidase [Marinilabilia sp.]|uniref:L,D-transpeptidase n=1 Tax=Marinilabilia sp. TaxID=2021252 RepID=UPI0025C473AB|nr:L,D-transpeptidase [Marinilabilia sp.]
MHLIRNQAKHYKDFALKVTKTISLLPGKSFTFLIKYYMQLTVIALIIMVPVIIRKIIWIAPVSKQITFQSSEKDLLLAQQKIEREIATLNKKLNTKRPKSFFLVINSASNEFVLYKGTEIVKKDKCSTGSYILLKNGEDQQWMFKTPKGEFRIQGKTTSPVWKKPDWAFVEEGLPVPSTNHYTRFEYGVLGDYALSIGHGYLIHGTLYQRFLGLPVTHGCIRLNDENLELVYKSLQVGSKVYIF